MALHSATQILQPKQRVLPQLLFVAIYIRSRATSLTAVSANSAEHGYFRFVKVNAKWLLEMSSGDERLLKLFTATTSLFISCLQQLLSYLSVVCSNYSPNYQLFAATVLLFTSCL